MVWPALLIAQSLESGQGPAGGLPALIASLTAALQNPLEVRWTDKSLLSILACTGIYIMTLALMSAEQGRRREGAEHGSAAWASPRQVNAMFAQKENKLLTRNVRLGLDTHKHRRSLNVLVIGGSGAAKTRSYVKPNILEANTNYVVTDPKQEVLTATGGWLKQNGYEIRVLNLVNLEQSDGYNPFRYAEMSFNFGTADVYLDGELVENIILYGQEATGQLMFERTGLEEGEHTIRLVQNAWNINLDYISYLPEQDQPTPPETTVTVDAMDAQLVYTGVWNDDYHDVFQEGTARYASSAGASVEFEFTGSEIRWYGQNDSNFGVASVYIDNEFVQQVNVNGAAAVGKLLFQKTDLPAGSHTIRIVCDTPVIDLDYLTYTTNA